LKWSSDNEDVATVSIDETTHVCTVTAVSPGSCTITATSEENGDIVATCAVTVKVPLKGVELDKTSMTINEKDTAKITATLNPENASNQALKWASDNEDVATVNVDETTHVCTVTAVSSGSCTITATSEENGDIVATCTVTVNVPLKGIELDKTSMTINEKETAKITATINPENASNQALKWVSDNEDVATVSIDETTHVCTVTAVSPGSCTITATSEENGDIVATCTVTVKVPLNGIELDKTSVTLNEKDTAKITATVNPENASNQALKWTSDNEAVATVSIDETTHVCTVTAVSSGSCTITATSEENGDIVATCTVTVNVPLKGIELDKTSVTINEKDTAKITATINPENASNQALKWTSDNEDVATVSIDETTHVCTVTAVSPGSCTITATSEENGDIVATCTVTVNEVSAVDDVKVDVGGSVRVYNLQGVLIYDGSLEDARLKPGFYVVRSADGVRKIVIK
jgi:uncharacterized protein YjdB